MGLRGVDPGDLVRLAVDQPVQEAEDVGLGGDARVERQLDRTQHRLLIMLQDQREGLYHLPITTRMFEKIALQLPERIGHLGEGCAVAQGSGLALDHRQRKRSPVALLP